MGSGFSWSSQTKAILSFIQDNGQKLPVFVCQCQRLACHKNHDHINREESGESTWSLISVVTLNFKALHLFFWRPNKNHRGIQFRNTGGELYRGNLRRGVRAISPTPHTKKFFLSVLPKEKQSFENYCILKPRGNYAVPLRKDGGERQ